MLGSNKYNALLFDLARKRFVLTQKAVARVHRFCACTLTGLNDDVAEQVALAARRRANVYRLIGKLNMAGVLIRIGIHRHRGDAHFLGGSNHAASNLTPVGNQDFLKHSLTSNKQRNYL